jgi:hypothetical protein
MQLKNCFSIYSHKLHLKLESKSGSRKLLSTGGVLQLFKQLNCVFYAGCILSPAVIPKEIQRLAEPVLRLVLPQDHVVGGGGRHKDDGRHVVEALDPLPPLVPLPAHVEHVELDPVHPELFPETGERFL